MERISWKKLDVLYVSGATPETAAEVIAPRTNVGGEMRPRIHKANGGVLVQVRDTDPDAGKVRNCLISKFGKDRVVDASQARPNELAGRQLAAG